MIIKKLCDLKMAHKKIDKRWSCSSSILERLSLKDIGAHVKTEEKDRFEAPQPENQNNPIPVLVTSASRTYQDNQESHS